MDHYNFIIVFVIILLSSYYRFAQFSSFGEKGPGKGYTGILEFSINEQSLAKFPVSYQVLLTCHRLKHHFPYRFHYHVIVDFMIFIVWRRRAGERARGDPRIFGNRGQPQEVFFQLSLIFAMFHSLAEKGRGKGARESWNSREMRRSSGNYHVVIDCHLSVYSSVFVVFGNRVRTVPKTINK